MMSTVDRSQNLFETMCAVARVCATTANLQQLLDDTLQIVIDDVSLDGAVVWLRSSETDLLTLSTSRLPQGFSTSAIPEDAPLLQQVIEQGSCIVDHSTSELIIQMPATYAIALTSIETEDTLLGLLGYVGKREELEAVVQLLEACADVISAPILSALLRRQQQEADDVADTLFRFAGELRAQGSLDSILSTLNHLALRVFNCDWTAVFTWANGGAFQPMQIVTRVGMQDVANEPLLTLEENPFLEMVITDPELKSLRDLRDQPNAMPWLNHHGVRGVMLLPLLHEMQPMGLLALGYRTPLVPLSSRSTALAQGVARMVAVALDRTRARSSA